MGVEIRNLKAADFPAWSRLMQQVHDLHATNRPDCYRACAPFTQERLDELVADPSVEAFVAEIDGEVAGLAVMVMRKPVANPVMQPRRVAFLGDLCVDARYRRRGVGTALLQEARRRAAEHQADSMELMAWSFNEAAIRFYERAGFGVRSLILEQPVK